MSRASILDEDITFIIGFIIFSIAIGIAIYRLFAGLSWIDSFYNASMILSGAGPVNVLTTSCSKVLAGLYTLYSGIFFLILLAIIIGRVVNLTSSPS